MDSNANIIKKLEYIGLDLENIPDKIKHFEPLEYRPSKYDDDHKYKVYRYIDINDIEILLTKSNRLSPISEKYRKGCSFIPVFKSKRGRKYRIAYTVFIYGVKY